MGLFSRQLAALLSELTERGPQPSLLLLAIVGVVVLAGVLLTVFAIVRHRRPIRRADTDTHQAARALFAQHLIGQLKRVDGDDYRFTELEADMVAHGKRKTVWGKTKATTIKRHERSLSKALARTGARLSLLRGEPGAGKSAALRHLALEMAEAAIDMPSGVIALYIDLNGFAPAPGPVSATAVQAYIWMSLAEDNDGVDQFLRHEFDNGLENGTWLFLFDSFDEIPDILSATDANDVVKAYGSALHSFVHGMHNCRSVIASREYRGAEEIFGDVVLTMSKLTPTQQRQLVRNYQLSDDLMVQFEEGLAIGDTAVQRMADNPMFLGLICEYLQSNGSFPEYTHSIFETYVDKRLQKDGERLSRAFDVTPRLVQDKAQQIAFTMTLSGLGLKPKRIALFERIQATSGSLSNEKLTDVLDALVDTGLAQRPEPVKSGDETFTFKHRRIQEYFVTCHLISDQAVSSSKLLVDGSWREAVTSLLQTQTGDSVGAIVNVAEQYLDRAAREVSAKQPDEPFAWPAHSLHIMKLLTAGLQRADSSSTDEIAFSADVIIRAAWESESRRDKRQALEVLGICSDSVKSEILGKALNSNSDLLRSTAFKLLGRMEELPEPMQANLLGMLIGYSYGGRLKHDKVGIKAQLRQLGQARKYSRSVDLLIWAPLVDLLSCVVAVSLQLAIAGQVGEFWPLSALACVLVLHLTFYSIRQYRGWALGRPTGAFERRLDRLYRAADLGDPLDLVLLSLSFMIRIAVLVGLDLSIVLSEPLWPPEKLSIGHVIFIAWTILPALYVLAWPYGFFYSLRKGFPMRPILVPIAPLVGSALAIYHGFEQYRVGAWRRFRNSTRQDRKELLADIGGAFAAILVLMAAILALSAVGVWLLRLLGPEVTLPEWVSWGTALWLALGASVIAIIFVATRIAANRATARRDDEAIDALRARESVTPTDVGFAVSALRTSDAMVELVRAVRRDEIHVTEANIWLFKQYLVEAEEIVHRPTERSVEQPEVVSQPEIRRAIVSEDVIDELVRLLDEREGTVQ